MSAGHGERAGDAVRAGVRREEVPHDGRVHAAVVDRAVHVRGAAAAHVLLRGGRAAADGAAAGAGGDGGEGVRVVHPAALLLRLPLPAAALPAVPDEELRQRRRRHSRALRPPPRKLAPRLQAPLRPRRHRPHAQLLLVGHRRHALRLRRMRRLPRHLARLLARGLRRHVGVRQALLRVRCHAMVRTYVYAFARYSGTIHTTMHAGSGCMRTMWWWSWDGNCTCLFIHAYIYVCSLENWYYRILVLLTGNLKDAAIAVDALSIW
jgi:hypothetical protein